MIRIAPFEAGIGDVLNIGLRSLVGPAVFVVLLLATSRRWLRIATGAILSLGFFGVLTVYGLYHAWSGSIPHAALIVHLGEAKEILPQVVHQVATGWSIVVISTWFVQMIAVGCLPDGRAWSRRMAGILIGCAVTVAIIHGVTVRIVWDAGDRVEANRLWVFDLNESAARFGILQGWWRDSAASMERRRYPIDQEWPGTLTGRPAAPVDVLPRAQNVILVQVESLDPWVIQHDVGGHAVMPHLRALAENARSFPNFFAQHSGGGSSDAELSAYVGVLPLATHSGLLTADWNVVRPLPALLAEQGWSTAAFHANRASYFNRNVVYPRLGFERFYSENNFVGRASGWESVDAEFMRQTLKIIDSMKEPFFASLISLQSHGPFRHHMPQPKVDPGAGASRIERDYLQCMHEVDEAFGVLAAWLNTGDRREDTAVLVFGDHRSKSRGPESAGPEAIPLMVIDSSVESGSDKRVGTHLDVGPTVLDLVGVKAPDGWLGTTLLDDGPGAAVFNTLNEVRLNNGEATVVDAQERMPFLLYSASVLGQ